MTRHARLTPGSIGLAGMVVVCMMSCTQSEDPNDRQLARAYDQVLYWSDLRQIVPMEATPEDSTAIAQRYINNWVQQQAVLHMAETNLSVDHVDLEEQMEEYRRSLVIFNYEQALVDQKLDTSLSDAQIEAYYTDHKSNFELKDNIIRARWFKVNEPDKRVVRKMEERFLSGKNDQLREVELWLAQLGVAITDRSQNWTPAAELLAEVPIEERQALELFERNGKRVVKEGAAAWFVEVLDHRLKDKVSPLELVRQDIRSILLNQRKLKLIEAMRANVYKEALDKDDVEIYQ